MTGEAGLTKARSGKGCRVLITLFFVLSPIFAAQGHAQSEHESSLSDGEVDKLREAAISPPDRLMVFVGFLNERMTRIGKLSTGPRKPGREEDIHELMEQCAAILDDLTDNLDDYNKRHRDVRKVLPKLIAATESWATGLKTPPENQEYSVSRKLALESLNDVHETAIKMVDDQKAWFAAHPPAKDAGRSAGG